jgi:hypothetical protein
MVDLNRSDVEFAKRVFLDRLTVDSQPLLQPANIDQGPGDAYDYGNVFDPFDFGVGGDCSGVDGNVITAAMFGPSGMTWGRLFSTETFPANLQGFQQVDQATCLSSNSPIKVFIMHGGGGPNSHMMCIIDGWQMESNGDYGTCTAGAGGTSPTDPMWDDWWIYNGGINEDITYRQPMSYPRGLDYAGGIIPGAVLNGAGFSFVCRYLTDGGPNLPGKQLQQGEFQDLQANGIGVVFNYETSANFMLTDQGSADAAQAVSYIESVGGPSNPFVYFSADWDAAEGDQNAINNFLTSAGSVLGGPSGVGIYGDYYVCKRALDAGVASRAWQTEAWSGSQDGVHIDSRVSIVQRNALGYTTLGGVECDLNEAHTPDIGAYLAAAIPGTPVPTPNGPIVPPSPIVPYPQPDVLLQLIAEQLMGPWDSNNGMFIGWPQNGKDDKGNNLFLNDLCVEILNELVTGQAKTIKPRRSNGSRSRRR